VVLIVDDDPSVLDLHRRLVEQAGCRAVCARSGRAALEILEYSRPDLILLDLMMPELDGFAVLDALRARETTRDIPAIVLTVHVLDETDIERLSRGVAAIMSKGLFHTHIPAPSWHDAACVPAQQARLDHTRSRISSEISRSRARLDAITRL